MMLLAPVKPMPHVVEKMILHFFYKIAGSSSEMITLKKAIALNIFKEAL
jgi:hypothetical protein